ncbi:MAG: hypothetical protein M3437_14085 [Chloroflexota bacterium]|nr:hypothetical protein [Chloroflexota bacterium]MDQ5865946.1 hypothetical protein [Chloroflexota bacterium]
MSNDPGGPRRLLILSSQSTNGDQDGPPDVKRARGGALGAVRSLQKEGRWPEGLDLLVLSDAYGLVEPAAQEEPVPVPFTRAENPNWWDGFVGRNLDNMAQRRGYSDVFVLVKPEHAQAVRASQRIRRLAAIWAGNEASAALDELKAWIGSHDEPEPVPVPVPTDKATGNLEDRDTTSTLRTVQLGQIIPFREPAPTEPEPPSPEPRVDIPEAVHDLIEDAIYSDRFMLVASKLNKAQLGQVRRDLEAAWARRSARRHERPSVSNVVVKTARLPWSHSPAATLYMRLLESVGMPSVLGSINKAVTQAAITEPGRYKEILARLPQDESDFVADLLYLLWEASSRMDKDEIAMLRAYLSDTATHIELRRMGIPRNLSLEDRYEVLRVVLQCISGLAPEANLSDHRRVWLWLDEIENVLGYSEHERWELVKALETFMGNTPPYLTVWLNISPTSPATSEEVQAALENNLVITDDLTR